MLNYMHDKYDEGIKFVFLQSFFAKNETDL